MTRRLTSRARERIHTATTNDKLFNLTRKKMQMRTKQYHFAHIN